MARYDPRGGARDARHRVARDRRRNARGAHDAQRRRLSQHGPPRRRQRAPAVQGHGRALRGLRLRPRGRPRRGRADRALHDGRRRVRAGLHDRSARASSWPARTRAASTAPIGWAATASRTRPSSAASPATRWPRGCARDGGVARARPGCARRSDRARRERRSPPDRQRSGMRWRRSARRSSRRCGTTRASCATRAGLARAASRLADLAGETRVDPAPDRCARPRVQPRRGTMR